jgi:hypothetical protein
MTNYTCQDLKRAGPDGLTIGARWPAPVARRKGPAEEENEERTGELSVPVGPDGSRLINYG